MGILGFPTEPSSGGNFLPIVKYDARAGRIFRVDRDNVGGEWGTTPFDITKNFRAVFDLENLEVGWIDFNAGGPPVFAVVQLGQALPSRPTPTAKNGARIMVKLAKEIGGDKPIREIANNSKAFLSGLEDLVKAYFAEREANPGKLPVVVIEDTIPIKAGQGDKASTNYKPVFKIKRWVDRGDLMFQPKGGSTPPTAPQQPATTPPTGSTRVDPPKASEPGLEDDFG